MVTSLGPFKFISVDSVPSEFTAILIPDNFTDTIRVEVNSTPAADYTVDWGNGSPVTYSDGISSAVAPSGNITVSGAGPYHFRVYDAGITKATITGGHFLTDLIQSFINETKLTEVDIDSLANVTDAQAAFSGCTSLTTGMDIDMPACTNFRATWRECSFTSFASIDVSAGQDFGQAWQWCTALTVFPTALDFGEALDCSEAFARLYGLTTFPDYDFPKCTDFTEAFRASRMTTIGALGTEAGEIFHRMFQDCDATTIAALDTTSTTQASADMFLRHSLTSPDATERTDLASASGFDFN